MSRHVLFPSARLTPLRIARERSGFRRERTSSGQDMGCGLVASLADLQLTCHRHTKYDGMSDERRPRIPPGLNVGICCGINPKP